MTPSGPPPTSLPWPWPASPFPAFPSVAPCAPPRKSEPLAAAAGVLELFCLWPMPPIMVCSSASEPPVPAMHGVAAVVGSTHVEAVYCRQHSHGAVSLGQHSSGGNLLQAPLRLMQ
eukprot:1158786-Pelagomonas_calceolata.AAC.4